MFRDLRRRDRQLSQEKAKEVLEGCRFGVLSLMGDDGFPYGVPLHYVLIGQSLYFHCSAQRGHMLDALMKEPQVSFTAVETEDGIKSRSAVIFGTAGMVPEKGPFVLEKMIEKYVPEPGWEKAKAGIPSAAGQFMAVEVKIRWLSGKWIDMPEGR